MQPQPDSAADIVTADFKGKRLRSPLNPAVVVRVRGAWPVHPVAEHDRRRFALLLESGECAYADEHGALLGGWKLIE